MTDRLKRAARTALQAGLGAAGLLAAAKLKELQGFTDVSGVVSAAAAVLTAGVGAALSAFMYQFFPPSPPTPPTT
jgi:hypothetical protein